MALYVLPDEVRNWLGVDSSKYDDTYLESLIRMKMDYIDRISATCWNGETKQLTEYHDITRPKWGFWIYRLGYPVFLSKCWIKSVDKLEVWQGCLPEDVIVYTGDGAKRLGDISVGEYVEVFDGERIRLAKVVDKRYTGYRDVYRVVARDYEIIATNNHPFLIVEKVDNVPLRDEKGRFVRWDRYRYAWKELKDLKVGDIIVVRLRKRCNNGIKKLNEITVTESVMRLLGFWVGDGNYSCRSKRIDFALYDTVDRDEYRGLVINAFGIEPKFYDHEDYKCSVMAINSVDIASWMIRNGFNGYSESKRIPEWVYMLDDKLKFEFLRGYIEADGTWTEYGASVSSVNRKLLEDVKVLCNMLGLGTSSIIVDRRRKGAYGNRPLYKLEIYWNKEKSVRSLTKGMKVNRITIEDLNRNGIGFRRIDKIEYVGKMDVYDITVNKYHNFVANGIVVHNSEWHDWISDLGYTEGRDGDYWIDYVEGIVYLNRFLINMAGKEVKVTYTYGRDDLPGYVKELCLLLVAKDLIENERRMFAIPEGAQGVTLADQLRWIDQRIAQLEELVKAVHIPIVSLW